uniref:Uncharacterized protein n=1 Tax=viral metagenome TaxID=1070528 RepID=A0A6M3K8G3_9ZZZZ
MEELKTISNPLEITEEKRAEMKANILKEWDTATDRATLAESVMEGYIFGKYAENEHYPIDLFAEIIAEIDAENAPKEEVIEEVIK